MESPCTIQAILGHATMQQTGEYINVSKTEMQAGTRWVAADRPTAEPPLERSRSVGAGGTANSTAVGDAPLPMARIGSTTREGLLLR